MAVDFLSEEDIVVETTDNQPVEVVQSDTNGTVIESTIREPDHYQSLDVGSDCSFSPEQADGSTVTTHNLVDIVIDPNTPPTTVNNTPSEMEVFRFRIQNDWHSDCSTVILKNFDLLFEGGDAENSGWLNALDVSIVDHWTDTEVHSATIDIDAGAATFEFDLTIPAGQTGILEVHVDASSASDVAGDWIRVSMVENSVDWSDTARTVEDFVHEGFTGGASSF